MFSEVAAGLRVADLTPGDAGARQTRVLVLCWEYPPLISGGLGVACKGLCEALLSRKDLSVHIAMPGAVYQPGACSPPAVGSYDNSPGLVASTAEFAAAILRWFDERSTGIVHCHDWLTFPAALQLHRHQGTPFVAHVHSLEVDRAPHAPNPQIVRIEQETFESAARIVAVSNFTKQRIIRAFGVDSSKISVVYNGASLDFQGHEEVPLHRRSKQVAFVGRLTTQKAPDRFLDVAEALSRWDPELRFAIVGVGDMLEELQRQAERRLGDRALFHGFLSPGKVIKVLADSRLMVMPSRSEPFGLAAIEAVQLGTPVVASRTVGFAEAVPAVASVDAVSSDALFRASVELLADTASATRQTARASRQVRRLTWQSAAGQMAALFHHLDANRR